MTAMESMADVTIAQAATMPRFEDGFINPREVLRQLAESVVNEIMSAEADQLCGAAGNSRNGYRERRLTTRVDTLTLRIPKLRTGSFFPDDALERYQRVDRAAWQRCDVHLMRDCARAASGSRNLQGRVSRIVAPIFRLKEAGAVRAAYHIAIDMLERCCRDAARILEEAEGFRLVAQRAVDASLELADELEAA